MSAGWAMIALGGVPLAIAGGLVVRALHFRLRGVLTTGRVVGYRRKRGIHGSINSPNAFRAPIVEFSPTPSQVQRFESSLSARYKLYPLGTEVPVRYLPLKPERAEIQNFGTQWFVPLGLGVLGLLPFSLGVLMLISDATGGTTGPKVPPPTPFPPAHQIDVPRSGRP